MPVQFNLPVLGALAAALIIVLAMLTHLVREKSRAARGRKRLDQVSAVLVEYFNKTGVGVSVGCVNLQGDRFTAFVESEPMKQFRLSHIIEIALRDHVKKTCGVELDKIYWRFPIKVAPREAATGNTEPPKRIEGADDYINEGLVHYKDLPKSEATEIPWESFEEAAVQEAKKGGEPAKVQG
ncbi:MAG TPA: hypothetical protein VF472_22010 [Burkholderiaceae bacterium]